MRRILIIADDLSGAADCGMACASAGLSASVVLGDAAGTLDVNVLSVDGDTRRLPPREAANETAKLLRRYRNEEQLVFKKLDSTLRGNIGSELAAVLEAQRNFHSPSERIIAILAPAFPANGRITLRGRQYVNDRPLEETEIWQRDERRSDSQISAMLQSAKLTSALLDLDAVRSPDSLPETMSKLAEQSDVLICDAETGEDLRAIADAAAALGPGTVWAGSAGLAYHLPTAIGMGRASRTISPQQLAAGPTLFAVGTVSRTSREQARLLASAPNVTSITIPPDDLLAGNHSLKWQEHEHLLSNVLENGGDVVALLGMETEAKIDVTQSRLLAEALARMIVPHSQKIGALVVTGGETARCVMQACGIAALRLVAEVEPGLPFAVAENWSRPLPILTKAGDFGTPQTLLHCLEFLRNLDRNPEAAPQQGRKV